MNSPAIALLWARIRYGGGSIGTYDPGVRVRNLTSTMATPRKISIASAVSPTTSRPPPPSSGSCSDRSRPTTHWPCTCCTGSRGATDTGYGARPASDEWVFEAPGSTRIAVRAPPGKSNIDDLIENHDTVSREQAIEALQDTVRGLPKDADLTWTSPFPPLRISQDMRRHARSLGTRDRTSKPAQIHGVHRRPDGLANPPGWRPSSQFDDPPPTV